MKNIIALTTLLILFNTANAQTTERVIDVGTYQLHFQIMKGKGLPILFEAGNGSTSAVWKDILQQIHDETGATLITYDRAGLGSSTIDPDKANLPDEIKGLKTALKKLGYAKEIFIVNHSFGSFYSILFANNNKKKVKAAVFIDPALPCNYTKERNKEGNETITPELWQKIQKEAAGLYYILKNYEQIDDLMSRKTFPAEIPATVIAAEKQVFLKTDAYKEEWRQCVKSFGELPGHNYVFAKNTGHTVWQDDPKLVIHEIVKLYAQVNKK